MRRRTGGSRRGRGRASLEARAPAPSPASSPRGRGPRPSSPTFRGELRGTFRSAADLEHPRRRSELRPRRELGARRRGGRRGAGRIPWRACRSPAVPEASCGDSTWWRSQAHLIALTSNARVPSLRWCAISSRKAAASCSTTPWRSGSSGSTRRGACAVRALRRARARDDARAVVGARQLVGERRAHATRPRLANVKGRADGEPHPRWHRVARLDRAAPRSERRPIASHPPDGQGQASRSGARSLGEEARCATRIGIAEEDLVVTRRTLRKIFENLSEP